MRGYKKQLSTIISESDMSFTKQSEFPLEDSTVECEIDPKTIQSRNLLRVSRTKDEESGLNRLELYFVCYDSESENNENGLTTELRTIELTMAGLIAALRNQPSEQQSDIDN